VLVSESVYGGSTELLRDLGPRHGITPRFVPGWDTAAVSAAVTPKTRALLVETISNPMLRVPDLPALGALARERGVALVVDSTFATPVLARPLTHGATAVVHSVSKYIGGHGDLIGGVVAGAKPVMERVARYRKLVGAVMDPFTAWLAVRGMRTLPLRVERQCATAARLADAIAGLPGVRRVIYPGRPDHPDHARARALLPAMGAIVTMELADGAAARRFFDRVRVIARAASLGEVASLLTHPASFSHKALSAEERKQTGISDGLLRISVGLEDPEDIEEDVRQALS
jgi:methionine-gamma-lyase